MQFGVVLDEGSDDTERGAASVTVRVREPSESVDVEGPA